MILYFLIPMNIFNINKKYLNKKKNKTIKNWVIAFLKQI